MTDLNKSNREIYLDVCKKVWHLDDKSMEYIAHRTSDDWEPVEELKKLIGTKNSTYEDQRIRFDIDMSEPAVQSLFEKDDSAYAIFKDKFSHAISSLASKHSCKITYQDFINNKVVFNKNVTKIKKVFETIYKEDIQAFRGDFCSTDESLISDYIVRAFERIGATKKSSKKLQFVISFNPMDWLLASTAESFSSCFNINNSSGGYQYCLGLPFLCGDKNRMMLYITNGTQKECMGIKVDSVQTRTWCILDKSNLFTIVKWYPNDTVGVSPVNAITGNDKFVSRERFTEGKYQLDMLSTKKGVYLGVYSDMGQLVFENGGLKLKGKDKTGQQWFTNNGIPLHTSKFSGHSSYHLTSDFGHQFGLSTNGFIIPRWRKLGLNVDMMFHEATCSHCGEDKTGFFFSDDDDGYKFLCKDCFKDNMYVCECCGKTKEITGKEFTVKLENGGTGKVCSECSGSYEKYICSCCGTFTKNQIMRADDGTRICNPCVDNGRSNYLKCESCGTLTKSITYKYNTFSKTVSHNCSHCSSSDGYYTTFGKSFKTITRTSVVRGTIE